MLSNRKILSLNALLDLRRQAQSSGKTVVHCHGCFDIVHPGHIHHLQFARSLGDLLIVTVSADSHVNKGVTRPLIPDDLRAQSLAALECVDFVYINPDPTAKQLLETLRPNVYVKGREYEENQDPRFLAERDAVVRNGGRVVFSSGDVIFSSTALIGTLARPERFHDQRVSRLRERFDLSSSHLKTVLQNCRGKRVLVVGDYILDRYHFCDATGVAQESPMLSLRPIEQRDYDGGAGVIALHLAGLGAKPTLVSSLADDDLSGQAAFRLSSQGVDIQCPRNRRQLVCKHRYLADQTKLFKVDEGSTTPGDAQLEGILAARVLAAAQGADAVIFADFGYGMITETLLKRILPTLRQQVNILAADVSGKQTHLHHFRGVDLLCPTEREVRDAEHDYASGLGAAVWKLLEKTQARGAIVTLGKQGLVTFDGTQQPLPPRLPSEYIPALSGHCVDPLGCGDALLATATLALTAGASLEAAAFLGAVAAGIEVQELGNQPVDSGQIIQQLERTESIRAAA